MKMFYLEVTFRHGNPMAAYLYLPRLPKDKSHQTSKTEPGMIIDYTAGGKPIGIEITAPAKVTVTDLNQVLASLGMPELTTADVAPLKAARQMEVAEQIMWEDRGILEALAK